MPQYTQSPPTSFIRFPKTLAFDPRIRKAARLCGTSVPAMIGHVHLIWNWSIDFAQRGDLTGFQDWLIEDVALWTGESGKFYAALFNTDLLYEDEETGAISLVGWTKP